MFIDARSVADGTTFESDVCIIGAGAAGIALATPLAQAGLRVDLLESGGFETEVENQAMTSVVLAGREGMTSTLRLRYFGGSTNHWGGWCRPLDPFDFEAHSWIPGSGWPIERRDLDPYYEQAAALIGIDNPHFDFDPAEMGAASEPALLGPNCPDMEPVIWRVTQPEATRMGAGRYRDDIDRSPRVRCFLRANATELIPHAAGKTILHLEAATLSGRKLRFKARRYVLGCGAIENARLLLLSDSVIRGGVGNQNDLVGRYFADHGTQAGVRLVIPAQDELRVFQEEHFLLARDTKQPRPKKDFLATSSAPQGRRLDGVGFRTSNAHREKHRTMGYSLIAMLPERFEESLKSALAVEELLAAGKSPTTRKYPKRAVSFVVLPEQSPNPDSRVRLHRETDALGLRRVELDLRAQELDFRSRREGRELFALCVARAGSGRVRLKPVEDDVWLYGPGGHQTGTTRMADDPKQGVTDRNGRVHGLDNLYVAGGSLYPTAGWQHPTLTIFALTLRLADHLLAASA